MLKTLINQSGTSAEIMLYGIIGRWMDIDVDMLVKELDALKKQGITNITFFVNSEGGEVMQGQALYNYLQRTELNVIWVVDGIAASMMAMLLCNPKHKVVANKYSKFMYHRLAGMVMGNADQVRSYADTMELFEKDLIDMFASRTKMDAKKVKKDFFADTDKWLNAQEALELGFVNEIKDGAAIEEPAALTNVHDVYRHYNSHLLNMVKPNSEIKMKLIAKLMNLSENATEAEVHAAMQAVLTKQQTMANDLSAKDTEITNLKNKIAEQQKEKVKNLIDSAIMAKKFGEDMRGEYTDMATDNFERAEKIINSLAGVDPIVAQIGNSTVPDTEKGWTWDDYHKKGKLEALKATNLPRFKDLYKAKFNKDFKE